MVSSASNVRPNIVDTTFTMDEMVNLFSSKGLSLDDLVILSGNFYLFLSDNSRTKLKSKVKLWDEIKMNVFGLQELTQLDQLTAAHSGVDSKKIQRES